MDLDALSGSKDPFAALDEEDADKAAAAEEQDARAKAEIVHIRVQQRNGEPRVRARPHPRLGCRAA